MPPSAVFNFDLPELIILGIVSYETDSTTYSGQTMVSFRQLKERFLATGIRSYAQKPDAYHKKAAIPTFTRKLRHLREKGLLRMVRRKATRGESSISYSTTKQGRDFAIQLDLVRLVDNMTRFNKQSRNEDSAEPPLDEASRIHRMGIAEAQSDPNVLPESVASSVSNSPLGDTTI